MCVRVYMIGLDTPSSPVSPPGHPNPQEGVVSTQGCVADHMMQAGKVGGVASLVSEAGCGSEVEEQGAPSMVEIKYVRAVSDISMDSSGEENATPTVGRADNESCSSPYNPEAKTFDIAMDTHSMDENFAVSLTPHSSPLEGDGCGQGEVVVAERRVSAESVDAPEPVGMSEDAEGVCGSCDSSLLAPPPLSPTSAQPTPLKTPGKRKVRWKHVPCINLRGILKKLITEHTLCVGQEGFKPLSPQLRISYTRCNQVWGSRGF